MSTLPKRNERKRYLLNAEYICEMAPQYSMRTGQLLFNSLRHEISKITRATNLDTFYREMTFEEVAYWLEEHIIYDDFGIMTHLINDGKILWEEGQNG